MSVFKVFYSLYLLTGLIPGFYVIHEEYFGEKNKDEKEYELKLISFVESEPKDEVLFFRKIQKGT